jgi:hypothetical protein
MPAPHPFPCGQPNTPPCPPQPALRTADNTATYTALDMATHGQNCWLAAKAWDRDNVTALLNGDIDRMKAVIAELERQLKGEK